MIISRNSITVSRQRDIESYYRFYKLQASTASVPVKPMNNATIPPSGWSKTEPAYTEGSTNSLYFVDLTNYSDGTFEYSDVSLSSSYEAAKQAYNKAVSAGETANTANANAESKNAVFYQTEAPPTTRRKLYDVWYDTDDGAKMYYWDGAAWTAKQFGGNALGDNCIAARHIVAHSITTNEITAENIVGSNGWINLAQGTFNYGNALIWNGSQITVNGVVDTDALTATGGTIGGIRINSSSLWTEKEVAENNTTYAYRTVIRGANNNDRVIEVVRHTPGNTDWVSQFYVRYDGYLYTKNAKITGDITATALTAQNVYYLHDSAGTKKAVLASSDLEFRDNAPVVNIGTGFTYVNIKNNLFANGQLMVGANGGGSLWCGNFYGGDIECSTINGGSYYNIELGNASTGGTAFTLPSAGTYLLITGHNSTAGLNGIHIVRTSGNTAFKVAGAANITVTVSGTRLTVKTGGGTVNVYAVKLG